MGVFGKSKKSDKPALEAQEQPIIDFNDPITGVDKVNTENLSIEEQLTQALEEAELARIDYRKLFNDNKKQKELNVAMTQTIEELKAAVAAKIGASKAVVPPVTIVQPDPAVQAELDQVRAGVRKLFKEMDDAHTGKMTGTPLPDASVKHLIGKFLMEFPFLRKR